MRAWSKRIWFSADSPASSMRTRPSIGRAGHALVGARDQDDQQRQSILHAQQLRHQLQVSVGRPTEGPPRSGSRPGGEQAACVKAPHAHGDQAPVVEPGLIVVRGRQPPHHELTMPRHELYRVGRELQLAETSVMSRCTVFRRRCSALVSVSCGSHRQRSRRAAPCDRRRPLHAEHSRVRRQLGQEGPDQGGLADAHLAVHDARRSARPRSRASERLVVRRVEIRELRVPSRSGRGQGGASPAGARRESAV